MVVFPYEQIYSVTWIVLCGLFLHWLFPREPFMTGVALAFHLSQIHSGRNTVESVSSHCTC